MARQARTEYPNAIHHVSARGNARQKIFGGDQDRVRFVEQLSSSLELYHVKLHAYCLMDNHYHLLVKTPYANLSRFMQRLNTSYALYYRYQHNRTGHLLQGRYGAKLVQDGQYAVRLTRYIHLNPIKTAKGRQMEAIDRIAYLEAYKWSSYRGYVRKRAREDMVDYEVLEWFDDDPQSANRRYRKYLHRMVAVNDDQLVDLLQRSKYAVGDEEYVWEIEDDLKKKRTGEPRDRDVDLPEDLLVLAAVDRMVCAEYGIQPKDLKAHGRAAGEAKNIALALACKVTGETQRNIGAHYGGIGSAAVNMARKKVANDEGLSGRLSELAKKLLKLNI